jgi:excinuclease UvrABC nuclease subunit
MTCRPYDILAPFTLRAIDRVNPDAGGVYGFWYRKDCVYIGLAVNLRSRLKQHWSGSHNDGLKDWMKAKKSDLQFNYKIARPEDDIKLMERFFIKRFSPKTNVIVYTAHQASSWVCDS